MRKATSLKEALWIALTAYMQAAGGYETMQVLVVEVYEDKELCDARS